MSGRSRNPDRGRRLRLALTALLAAGWACDRPGPPPEPGAPAPAAAEPDRAAPPTRPLLAERAGRLIKRWLEDPGDPVVLVDVDYDSLAALRADADDPLTAALRDPLDAARVFAAVLEFPAAAELTLLERSTVVEEGVGMFVATARVTDGSREIVMRLVSAPDEGDRPTLWVLNDFERR